jgi:CheY-like chemotaxis protein
MDILLVEDNLENAKLFIRILQAAGHKVVHTTRGLDGMRAAHENKFSVIILDFDLPDIDGAQVGLALRRKIGTTPLIALTAQAEKVTQAKAKLFGFDAFISKPCTEADLLKTIALVAS